jgi:hypothetical protein
MKDTQFYCFGGYTTITKDDVKEAISMFLHNEIDAAQKTARIIIDLCLAGF